MMRARVPGPRLRCGAARAALALAAGLAPALAPAPAPAQGRAGAEGQAIVPPLAPLVAAPASELRDVVERYAADRAALLRRYDAEYSPERRQRLRDFYQAWQARLRELDFDRLGVEGRIDYVLLDHELRYQLALLDREEAMLAEMQPLLPFAPTILALHDARRRREPADARAAADTLAALLRAIEQAREAAAALAARPAPHDGARSAAAGGDSDRTAAAGARKAAAAAGARKAASDDDARARRSRIVAFRAANTLDDLRNTLQRWHRFHAGYDPLFTWWTADPYRRVDSALVAYGKVLRRDLAGIREGEPEPIIGDPIGAAGMAADLAHEMIPYSPEELIRIAEREFAWCEAEMRKAAREMGFGDDWKAALEKVKTLHVPPGQQPTLVRDLAYEAVAFVKERDLVTIPPLAEEIWRIEMMSPERQRVAPFFLGGEVILVSFPTDGMSHEEKLMSMRGNNIHFSRATVHHELIPGHHLQGFMTSRYNSHRRVFATPFWTEGWSLYWEMLLWDLGFPKTPEDRVGMLFWRAHRAARIMFSLGVHLGTMTPDEAIELLVERVGHERANAEAEVRRSFNGTYPPLYQAAYMIGGLQIRALYKELVETGRVTAREFHDAILRGGRMPIEMVRARLRGELLPRDYTARWRFAGDP
ncbi:MAG TPA: DUF885 family protein [Longimicrobiales bacterium]